jgi:hypothetical protein
MFSELIEIDHIQKIKFNINNINNINTISISERLEKKFINKFNLNFLILEISNVEYDKYIIDDINFEDYVLIDCKCKMIGMEIYKGAKLTIEDINNIKKNDEIEDYYISKNNIFIVIKNISDINYEKNEINNESYIDRKIKLLIIEDPKELSNNSIDNELKLIFIETNIE